MVQRPSTLYQSVFQPVRMYFTTAFRLGLLISTFFTTVGGIVSLYAMNKDRTCRHVVQITALVFQCIALVACLLALITTAWPQKPQTTPFKPSPSRRGLPGLVRLHVINQHQNSRRSIIQTFVLIVVNIVCLIMIVLLYVNNAVYNIFGFLGSFLIAVLETFWRFDNVEGSSQ